ncbi:hypothetical protein ThrDRAFT_02395 [Frankia casuarinae]|nr:hypothetical protein CcI6DRAFT_03122 [Frankia sp. CcI6]EYT92012.1 hypothetical protein ThrDRAFT_02395 [Frankia casuarinae]KFB04910.1 hypothetical protein ALLO2DRAFT_02200 [Frankia sp. Allo2]
MAWRSVSNRLYAAGSSASPRPPARSRTSRCIRTALYRRSPSGDDTLITSMTSASTVAAFEPNLHAAHSPCVVCRPGLPGSLARPERDGTGPAALRHDVDHVLGEVDVFDGEVRDLGATRTGVHEQADDRLVAAGHQVPAGTAGEQSPDLIVGENGHRLFGDDGRAHPVERRPVEILFLGEPLAELLQRPEDEGHGCRGVGGRVVRQEGFDVGAFQLGRVGRAAVRGEVAAKRAALTRLDDHLIGG